MTPHHQSRWMFGKSGDRLHIKCGKLFACAISPCVPKKRTCSGCASFIFSCFLQGKSPVEIDSSDVKRFISYLAVDRRVAASTQNQAFCSLLFLFRHVLEKDLDDVSQTVRAKGKRRLPVVLRREEIARIFSHMSGASAHGPAHLWLRAADSGMCRSAGHGRRLQAGCAYRSLR